MAGELTVTEANGLFKRVYDRKVRDLRPSSAILQRRIGFNEQKKVGEAYVASVVTRPPNGFTYAGSAGGVIALKAPRNMQIKQVSLTPFEIDLREQIAYAALSRAVADGEGAFKSITGEVVSAMQVASANRLEASMLHGQRGYGTIESVGSATGQSVPIVITAATWAAGMWWALGEGSTWDSFTGTTKNNGDGPLILSKVTAATRTLTFTFSGTLGDNITAGDVLYPEGSYDGTTHSDMPGLLLQASNTTGTSLGLSATTYPNWAGNTYAVGGVFSHGVFEDMVSQLRDRGMAGKLTAYVSNKAWSVLATETVQMQANGRGPGGSSESPKLGIKSMSYTFGDIGDVDVVAHPFMKQSEMLLLPDDECDRIGSSDVTFGIPGMKEQFFRLVDGYNAVELQNFTDQAVILKKPSAAMVATGITY